MSNLAEQIAQDVNAAIATDELQLPTLPEVALRIRDVAEGADVNAAGLAAVIGEDPGLAARLIKVANSPMFRASRTIDDLQVAVSRLGVEYAANLATGLAMQQMFQATNDVIDAKMRSVWTKSTEIAGISAALTKHYTSLKTDQAALAGLTHNIGVLPILTWAEEHEGIIRDSLTLDRVIDSMHGELGTMLLSSWDFSDEIAQVPRLYLKFDRQSEQADYVDVVTVAYLQSLAGTEHPHAQIEWSTVPAFDSLGFSTEDQEMSLDDLIEDLEATVAAMAG